MLLLETPGTVNYLAPDFLNKHTSTSGVFYKAGQSVVNVKIIIKVQ
jgi:hypothetical protein